MDKPDEHAPISSAFFETSSLKGAHKHSIFHIDEIMKSGVCGCFYCLARFDPPEIKEWCDDGATAICPHCFIDSVIGDRSRFPVNDEDFLRAMRRFWFEE